MKLLEPLSEEDLETALKSIGETADKLKINRELIKHWMKCQPHLPSEDYDERIIDIYLRGCKHDLERVKRKLDTYFTVRTLCPDYFGNWNPYSESSKKGWENFISIPLPKPLPNGYRIVLNKYMKYDSVTFQYKDIVRNMFMLADIRMVEEPPFLGDIFIFDIEHYSAGHLAKMSLPLVKKALHCTQFHEIISGIACLLSFTRAVKRQLLPNTCNDYLNALDVRKYQSSNQLILILPTRIDQEEGWLGHVKDGRGSEFVSDNREIVKHIWSVSNFSRFSKNICNKLKAYPQRLNQIHMCNASLIVDKIIYLFKQFMKEKVRNRFYIHTKYETMHQFIPKKYLPEDYGGDLPSSTELHKLWVQKIQSYKSYFDKQNSVKSNESKRVKHNNLSSDIFGCEGAFRKLNID